VEFIDRLVAFCVFMEHGEGITAKAPSYIEEKWIHCANAAGELVLLAPMDQENRQKYYDWVERWKRVRGAPALPPEEEVAPGESEDEVYREAELVQAEADPPPAPKKGGRKRVKDNQDQERDIPRA